MSWNYRIVHHKEKVVGDWYAVHAVYYNDDGTIYAMSKKQCAPQGETRKECMNDTAMMSEAANMAVLEYDMKFAKKQFKKAE